MSAFVIEIGGRGVVAFGAETRGEANDFPTQEWLQAELMALETDGRPLWDGREELFVRDAFPEEADRLQRAAAKGREEAEDSMVFLVPVNDPSDDD